MIPGLMTNFNARIDLDTLRAVRAHRFLMARMDAQTCSPDILRLMIEDALVCDLRPLPIVADVVRLTAIPRDLDVDWTNEPDGDIAPANYRVELDHACRIAAELGLRLWAPAISNLDNDSLKWLNDVRDAGNGWPAGLHGISAHSYGPFPHDGFADRDAEVKWLKAACAGLPYIITEFGAATTEGYSEDQQAAFYRDEWAFWQRHGAEAAFAFQLNDGPGSDREARYGIRRFDGTWKPSASTIPASTSEDSMIAATFVVRRTDLIPNGEFVTVRYPAGSALTVLSVQPDGALETRPAGTTGPWETARVDGSRLVFPDVDGKAFAFPLVD